MQGSSRDRYDVVIVGGGPAGLSSALWCADLGLSAAVFEGKGEAGGQLLWIHNPVTNYPGLSTCNGTELQTAFLASIRDADVHLFTASDVTSVDPKARTLTIVSENRLVSYSALILATGVRRRQLGIPGESEFRGRGILASGVGAKSTLGGKSVVIIGGGDAALENSVLLAEIAANVTLVHRRSEFSARAEFVDAIPRLPNVRVISDARVLSIDGGTEVESVSVESLNSGSVERIEAQAVLIRIGVIPNSELVAEIVNLDMEGYVIVDALGRSSVLGIYAVGDVSNPTAPTIAGAVGAGATAVKSIAAELLRA